MAVYTKVYQDISDIFDTYDISYPLDAYYLAKQMNLEIKTYQQLAEEVGLPIELIQLFTSEVSFIDNGIIYLNNDMPLYVRNFNILHEIYHYYDDHFDNSPENENLCNCFARNMIAPAFLIKNKNKEDIEKKFYIFDRMLKVRMNFLETDKWYFNQIALKHVSSNT